MSLVVDASVGFKWFLDNEPDADRALDLLRNGRLIAPDIVVAEICNAAWKSAQLGRISRDQVTAIARTVPAFFDDLVASAHLAARAVEIAEILDHPVYDALYLALAEIHEISVITADSRLAAKVRATQWNNMVILLGQYRAPPGE